LSKIISIGTAVPDFVHNQNEILRFMSTVYASNERERRAIKYLYDRSGISTRYSVLPDFRLGTDIEGFYSSSDKCKPFPLLEKRMQMFNYHAADLSTRAIRHCLNNILNINEVTHFITVTCTGLSAPGLDLQLMDLLGFERDIVRASVNFMGCYGAVHALRMADVFCQANPSAKVLIVCTELCTLHFQQEPTTDNIISSLLFGDGSSAVLVTGKNDSSVGFPIIGFHSEVDTKGKRDMAWELSTSGFKMTLNGNVPKLIELGFKSLLDHALYKQNILRDNITDWAIHPGGMRILDAISRNLLMSDEKLNASYKILREYGNMSSPTILFVLKEILFNTKSLRKKVVFGAAFGPGLSMETFFVGSPCSQQ
jgi:predicted naringenin-chalcone synthase